MKQKTGALPSVKTLMGLTDGDRSRARELRAILEGKYYDPSLYGLIPESARDKFPSTVRWISQCYNDPSRREIIMSMADEFLHTYGVECIEPRNNHTHPVKLEYCNAGDTYALTLACEITRHFWGYKYRFPVTSWGDYVERKERQGWRF